MVLKQKHSRKPDKQYFFLSILVSVGLVWYLFTKVDFKDLVSLFMGIHFPGFIMYLGLYAGLVVFRALRFHILVGEGKIKFVHMILVTMIRNLFVDLLPARMGALSYVYVLKRRFGFSFELGAATLLLSILFDFMVIAPLIIIAVVLVGSEGNIFYNPTFISLTGLFLVGFVLLIYKLVFVLEFFQKTCKRCIKIIKIDNFQVSKIFLDKFSLTIEETRKIQSKGIFLRVFFLSILVRLFKYGSLFYLLYSFLYNEGILLWQLSFWKVFLCSAGGEFSAMLPIHGIAGIGTWATAWSLVFQMLGFQEKLAILAGISIHLMTQVVEYTIGISAILFLLTGNKRDTSSS